MLKIFHDALSRKNYKINDFSRMSSGLRILQLVPPFPSGMN